MWAIREHSGVVAKASGVGKRVVAAAERMFGAVGWGNLEWWRSRRAWKAKLKAAFARVVQAEYVEMLSETDMGTAYLAIKLRFGRAAWIEDA
jgi:hypothetical protein